MRLLVLGGTAWLGGYLATMAVERGHHVTCLARGESGVAPPGADFEQADRDSPDAYREVARVEWDVVVDVSRRGKSGARPQLSPAAPEHSCSSRR